MIERQNLKTNTSLLLCGESDGQRFKRTFTILQQIGSGASSVTYEACYSESGRGVLKEIYPSSQAGSAVKRNSQGQLVAIEGMEEEYEDFKRIEWNYLRSYEDLMLIRITNEYQELATFIPHFEIYHGCDVDGHVIGTTYLWTPEVKVVTFAHICDEIHQHPQSEPEHKVVFVLKAIRQLAACVCAMHNAGFICRDLKPANFGFRSREGEVLPETISLFDLNDVCSVFGSFDEEVSTRFYIEMEAAYQQPNNQTDIYAIGAILFHALIITNETKEDHYLYKDWYYPNLEEMVNQSQLIQASAMKSHPRLCYLLTKILKNCLCNRMYRYPNCETLIEDLDEAFLYASYISITQKISCKEKMLPE